MSKTNRMTAAVEGSTALPAVYMNHGTQIMYNASRPTISVCIGSYNRERYIRECIDSVLAQTRPADEIIVVDDASTDHTVEVVKRYGDRIRLICRTTNSGNCAAARNDAMRASSGNYIAFLDSDDAWLPTKLEKQIQFMEAHPEISLSHTYCEIMDGESRLLGIRHEGRLIPTRDPFEWLMEHCWISTSSVMFRRELMQNVGLMNEESRFRAVEDWEYFIRIAAHHSVGLIAEPLTLYRKSASSISGENWKNMPRSVSSREMIIADDSYWGKKITKNEIVKLQIVACLESSIFWREKGYPDRARWFVRVWLTHRPFDPQAWIEFVKTFRS